MSTQHRCWKEHLCPADRGAEKSNQAVVETMLQSRGLNTRVVQQVEGVGQPRLDLACVRVLEAAAHVHTQTLGA